MMHKVLSLFVLFFLFLCDASNFAFANEQSIYESKLHSSEPQQFVGILVSHNKVRQKFNQQPLTWSNSLASYAQQWVSRLAETQNCQMLHRPNYKGEHDSERYLQVHGENLFWASAEKLANGSAKLQHFSSVDVVRAWAEEEAYYDYQTNTCQPGQDCGHFTQMIWHESQKIGCAKAVCADKSQIWACNYHPRGNYIGERPY